MYMNSHWMLYPVDIIKPSTSDLKLVSSEEVFAGRSPIGMIGPQMRNWAFSSASCNLAYNQSTAFYFHKIPLQLDFFKFSHAFEVICGATLGVLVSTVGFTSQDTPLSEPQLSPPERGSHPIIKINEVQVDDVFFLTETVMSLDKPKVDKYLSIFKFLLEIRRLLSHVNFIGELALWSFIEHYFSENKKAKTSDGKSLDQLLGFVYSNSEMEQKAKKKAIQAKISDIGESISKDYNEKTLRNILAHGKYLTLQEGWTEDNWTKFNEIHSELFDLVIVAIKKEIADASPQPT